MSVPLPNIVKDHILSLLVLLFLLYFVLVPVFGFASVSLVGLMQFNLINGISQERENSPVQLVTQDVIERIQKAKNKREQYEVLMNSDFVSFISNKNQHYPRKKFFDFDFIVNWEDLDNLQKTGLIKRMTEYKKQLLKESETTFFADDEKDKPRLSYQLLEKLSPDQFWTLNWIFYSGVIHPGNDRHNGCSPPEQMFCLALRRVIEDVFFEDYHTKERFINNAIEYISSLRTKISESSTYSHPKIFLILLVWVVLVEKILHKRLIQKRLENAIGSHAQLANLTVKRETHTIHQEDLESVPDVGFLLYKGLIKKSGDYYSINHTTYEYLRSKKFE